MAINWRFRIADIDDELHNSTYYASSERAGTLAALLFAGSRLIGMTVDARSVPYLFHLEQDEGQNRALLVFTAGTWRDIERMPYGKIPAQTFGNLTPPSTVLPGLALQLQCDSIDLSGHISPGQILIRSLSRPRLPLIGLQVVG
ncbi:MAG: hypothetical protein QW548_02305 [Candidatus Aenigmatarchaeota archaeon]